MESVLITGSSGFVGTALTQRFLEQGLRVTGVGTSPRHPLIDDSEQFTWISADTSLPGNWQQAASDADVVINLAGRNIFKYWTRRYKKAIRESRIETTRNLVSAISAADTRAFISASAVGLYGDCGDNDITESRKPGSSFLARVCIDWENQAMAAEGKDIPTALLRFGVVLGSSGGALSKMMPAFRFFAGGPLGNGQQWFPWIHLADLIRAVQFIIQPEGQGSSPLQGTFNLTSPDLVRHKAFARALGQALGRPSFMPAPAWVIRTLMGELGSALLESQKARPDALLRAGFAFKYERLASALSQAVNP